MTNLSEVKTALENGIKGKLFYVGSGKKEKILKFSSLLRVQSIVKKII